jgi:hypothetical protein
MHYSALGYITGKRLGSKVPYLRGLGRPNVESMKALGAACATSGSIALWHGEGVTPEANGVKRYLGGIEEISIGRADLEEAVSWLTRPLEDPIIVLGCPHATVDEIKEIAGLVIGRNLGGKLMVFTSRGVYTRAEEAGYIGAIEGAGGRVYRDTCMVVAPLREMGWREVATNSFKAAHYLAGMGLETRIGTIRELLGEGKE